MHTGTLPPNIFVTINSGDESNFWIYLKEGHAINRMLKENKEGRPSTMLRYVKAEE
jgi:hypothetical protein